MHDETHLLFLHGVGEGDPDGHWAAALDEALREAGYPSLSSDRVIAPRYARALLGTDDDVPMPRITVKALARDAAREQRRDFERRTGAIEFRLGRTKQGLQLAAFDGAVGLAVELPKFAQAKSYLTQPRIRAQVLQRVLDQLPESGRVVIVAHSLGSVIAADLLRRLPVGIEIVGLVTIGSPLANARFDVDVIRDSLKEPPANLGWWVNFWNALDPIVANRGLSSVFPWMLDFSVSSAALPDISAHSAVNYLAMPSVAEAIGYGVFGSRSRELVSVNRGADVPVDAAETITLLALRYGHHLKLQLIGDQRSRFEGALRVVQATAVEQLRQHREADSRPLPELVAGLAFDLSDPQAHVPQPGRITFVDKEDAVVFLTVLATQNVLHPFDISVAPDKRKRAMENLASEMELTSQFGADVFSSFEKAQSTLRGPQLAGWFKWGAVGIGAIAIVIATGGLALAAGGGLVGAAAITSALAAFGPGGMIGGLLTAGTLVTAGGGGLAYGLASSGTSAESVEAVVAGQLATAMLREEHGLQQDPAVWNTLVETEAAVIREHERLDEFSDEKSAALKELQRKITAVGRALSYLREHGLEPQPAIEASR